MRRRVVPDAKYAVLYATIPSFDEGVYRICANRAENMRLSVLPEKPPI